MESLLIFVLMILQFAQVTTMNATILIRPDAQIPLLLSYVGINVSLTWLMNAVEQIMLLKAGVHT